MNCETAIVHIGLHKTGTTSIQRTLHKNSASLLSKTGDCYLDAGANHSPVLYSMFCDAPERYRINILNGRTDADAIRQWNATERARIEAGLHNTDARRLLISGEDLSALSDDGAARLRDWMLQFASAARVVAVVRDPLEWASSNAQQLIKGGQSLEHVEQNPRSQNIKRKLETFVRVFGQENITVRHFSELRSTPDGLFVAFCDAIGVDSAWSRGVTPVTGNVSISWGAARIISALNKKRPPIDNGERGAGRYYGDIDIFRAIAGPRFQLPPEIRERVVKQAQSDAHFLRDTFGLDLIRTNAAAHSGFAEDAFDNDCLASIGEAMIDAQFNAWKKAIQANAMRALIAGDLKRAEQCLRTLESENVADSHTRFLAAQIAGHRRNPRSALMQPGRIKRAATRLQRILFRSNAREKDAG